MLIDAESRNTNDKSKKKKVLPDLNSICNSYLKDRKNKLKSTTYYKLTQIIDIYIKDKFRLVPVDKLIEQDFKRWYKFLSNYDINARSKNKYLNILKSIFKYVHIVYGYECLYIQRLKNFKDYSIKEPTEEFRVFSFEDFKKLYPGLNDYDKLLLLTLFLFGIRAGELLALTPKALLLDKNILSIYQAVSWKTEKKGPVIISPKSKTSKRTYPLPGFYKTMIIDHINKNNLKNNNYIFFSPLSIKKPLSSTSLQRKLNEWSKIIDYHLYPHLFRHSAISQLYASGLKLEDIKNLMGHSSEEITRNFYLHQTKESEKSLEEYLERMFLNIK